LPTTPKTTTRLLTVAEAAERLGTTERFARRLIAERRVTFVKLGTGRSSPVRIPEQAIDELIAAGTVEPRS
jgi:excisionase family DNA binding protein